MRNAVEIDDRASADGMRMTSRLLEREYRSYTGFCPLVALAPCGASGHRKESVGPHVVCNCHGVADLHFGCGVIEQDPASAGRQQD